MNFTEKLIVKLAGLLNVNLLGTAYRAKGIDLSSDSNINGEFKFLHKELFQILGRKAKYVFFDIGQNIGSYTEYLLKLSKNITVHGFEPNIYLIDNLKDKFKNNDRVILNHHALGERAGKDKLYVYKENKITGHGSIHKDVLNILYGENEVLEIAIDIRTIEGYCEKNRIDYIDFMKIDVEGHELKVLIGAGEFLKHIKVIQFEFNEMNIMTKVFLKDFYNLLKNFDFYRITEKGLIPLNEYKSSYEIFRIQNLIAINRH